ncbi:phytanoyl-CoA dioxygenase family protein [soil metagenome]
MNNNTLYNLGVRKNTLLKEEKDFLDNYGYLNLGQLLDHKQVDLINNRISELLQKEGEQAGSELLDSKYIRHPKEEGADRLANLVNKGPVFDQFYSHPRVLAGIAHVLGPFFKLSALNFRSAKPGKGLQKLHVDWHEKIVHKQFRVCNSIWLLDNFTKENGATRLIPGSHLYEMLPQDALSDPLAPHKDEIILEAPAGSVILFNSHTWHGGTTNHSPFARRAIHSYFCEIHQPQQVDQKRYILPDTLERIPADLQILLGLNEAD